MKRIVKRIIPIILAATALINQIPSVFAAQKYDLLVNETFNDYATNSLPKSVTVMGGEAKVVETGTANKELILKKNSMETTVRIDIGEFPKTFIFSTDIKFSDNPVNFSIGLNTALTSATQDSVLLNVVNGIVYTYDGRKIGNLNSQKIYTITFRITAGNVIDAYINNSCILYRWKLSQKNESGVLSIKKAASEHLMYVDNIRVYSGEEIIDNLPTKTYNTSVDDAISIGDDFGDYTFFDNHYCYTGPNATSYTNFTAVPKTNKIVLNRLIDYQSPEREDYIYMQQTDTSNDCYFDITLRLPSWLPNTNRKFSYYLLEGDFKKDNMGSQEQAFLLRDTDSIGSQINVVPVQFMPDGSLKLSNGKTVSGVIKKGEWFNYKLAIDLENSVATVYVNDELVADDIAIDSRVKTINMVRYSMVQNAKKGDTYIDNLRVTGLVKPYSNEEYYKTDVFSDEKSEIEYLEDKTAVHVYGKQMYVNGEKSLITPEPIYDSEKDELYMAKDSLKKLFGLEGDITVDGDMVSYGDKKAQLAIKEVDGEQYIGVKEYTEKIAGKKITALKNGLIFIVDRELALNDDDWNYVTFRTDGSSTMTNLNGIDRLNQFMTFERPTAEKLLQDFAEHTGDVNTHPRVLLTKDEFATLREKRETNEEYKRISDAMIQSADKYLTEDVATYKFDDSFRTLQTAENLLTKFRLWGYAYQMTKDQKYVDRAFEEFKSASTFPDFNTSHIIDTGEYCAAFAIGYDWLYEGFNEEQRQLIQDFVMEKALRPLASGLYGGLTSTSGGTVGWAAFKSSTNYNALINGGVICAATAFMETDPEWCANIISSSLKSSEYAYLLLAPGGGWVEAFTYWNFCMQYMIYEMATCDSAFGSSYGLENAQGVKDTVNYAVASIGTNGINNYHDATAVIPSETMYSYDTFAYLAKKFDNKAASAMRLYTLQNIGGMGLFDALYYDFDMGDNYMDELSELETVQKIDGLEMFSVRDTYDKQNAGLYFSTHFGPTECYHSQNDTGTFVLDLMGERWADDLGADDYNLQNELGYKQSDLYRYRTEGHNTLTINNATEHNQTGGLFFDIDKYESNENSAYMIADLPYLYKDVPEMKMGYLVGDNLTSVTMRTELTADKDSEVYWFMHTRADIYIDGDTAYLSKNGKNVKIELICNGENVKLGEMNAEPLSTSPKAPEQRQNEEFKKLYVRFDAKANQPTNLTIKISSVGKPSKPISDTPLSEWKLEDRYDAESNFADTSFEMTYMGSKITEKLPVYDGEFPEIKVTPVDPTSIVEIRQATNVDEKTVIKVWDKNKTSYSLGIVEYFTASGLNMNMFEQIVPESVEVSSEPEAANVKDNMLDGSYSTRWTCMALGETAVFDLGEEMELDAVGLAFWKGAERVYYFDVETSLDGITYTPVLTKAESYGDSTILQPYLFDAPIKARYIRYTGNGNSVTGASNVNSNVLEFRALVNKFAR